MRTLLIVGILYGVEILGGLGQNKFSLTDEKGNGKQETKKKIPTFVGSDGVERRVSPAAILEEMKRCLPPGLPIPLATAWPELPTHLEELPETKATPDEGISNPPQPVQEKRRVLRSNDAEIKTAGLDPTDNSMNVKLEGPTKDSVFSPKDFGQKKMAEALKEMLSKQIRHNLTGEYVDDISILSRHHKPKSDYEDYDYIEEPKITHARKTHKHTSNSFPVKRRMVSKRQHRNKYIQERRASKRRQNEIRKRPDYIDDYDQSDEDTESCHNGKSLPPQHTKTNPEGQIQSDELEKQILLSNLLEQNAGNNREIPERTENIDKFMTRSGYFKTDSGEPMDTLEGYQKILAVIMKLNTTLIRLLDRFSTMIQKSTNSSDGNQNEDPGKSSVIWDFMDLLMQQRRGARRKRDNGQYLGDNLNIQGNMAKDRTLTVEVTGNQTIIDSLKRLFNWYLNTTPILKKSIPT